jgi:hypothetical protein
MYTGSITLATKIERSDQEKEWILCAGEKISFAGGEFYVIASEHRWNYGGNPETVLSISRGGKYDAGGSFSPLVNVAKCYQEFKSAGGDWKSWTE